MRKKNKNKSSVKQIRLSCQLSVLTLEVCVRVLSYDVFRLRKLMVRYQSLGDVPVWLVEELYDYQSALDEVKNLVLVN